MHDPVMASKDFVSIAAVISADIQQYALRLSLLNTNLLPENVSSNFPNRVDVCRKVYRKSKSTEREVFDKLREALQLGKFWI